LSQKTTVLGAAHSKNFVILACTVLIQIQNVTDRQTDAQTIAKTRETFCFRAYKNVKNRRDDLGQLKNLTANISETERDVKIRITSNQLKPFPCWRKRIWCNSVY